MHALGIALFPTALGVCGVAWGARGIVAMQLPEAHEAHLRARLRRSFPDAPEGAPPAAVQQAMQRVAALLRGEAVDFGDVALDMQNIPEFDRRVYAVTQGIRPGHTLTYGEVAKRIGEPDRARAVGQALGRNPFAPIVPCHRVLAAAGKPGGFSARGGVDTKLRMLAIEGARVGEEPDLFDRTSAS